MKNNKKITWAFIFLIICLSFSMLLFMVRESDYFWHIKAGEYMFKNGILKMDIFSWFVKGKYWFSHEWLFEIIIYTFKLLFGKYHILVYGFCSFTLLLLIIFLGNKEKFLKNIPFSLLWLTLFLIFIIYAQARPHLLSFNLLALTIYLLFDLYNNENSKKIYFLPLITILWANVHGGSSNLPYIFCLIFILGGLFNFEVGKIYSYKLTKRQLRKYFEVMILCMLAVFVNVHGAKMFFYPYTNMMNTLMINNINEWKPTTLANLAHLPYYILAFVIVLILLISKKKISFIDFLLFLSVLFLGLKSIRFWGFTYIIMSFVIFNYVGKRKDDRYSLFAIVVVSFLFLILTISNYKSIKLNINNKFLNDDIILLIKKENPKRLFNMYNYGGELIYNDIEVFIDGRADLYSPYNYEDYLNISKLEKDFVKLIRKYDFDYMLVDNSYPIYTYLKYSVDYEQIYNNKSVSLYKKIAT